MVHAWGTLEELMQTLEIAEKNGKGVIAIKVFGGGDNSSQEERNASLAFALKSHTIHCMTIGMESVQQVDATVEMITDILKTS